ncbi:MAG: methyl-accepting chemotaxis protein [Fibrobacteres bacterium]|jgi:methyl-accepting chemotaxis protein|nr:methyl-accepting chemotaxis protein [Fibrobacterota bacterium]
MPEKTPARNPRHPVRNFIILPEFQWPYIIRLLAVVNLAGVVMAMAICTLFYLHYHAQDAGALMPGDAGSLNTMESLLEENLMDVIVPAFVIADVVSLAVGLALSLYFSRKISVPIYRISKWAEVVSSGDLGYRLKFRPGDDLQTLEAACNKVGETYAKIIEDMRRQITEANLPLSPKAASIRIASERASTEA